MFLRPKTRPGNGPPPGIFPTIRVAEPESSQRAHLSAGFGRRQNRRGGVPAILLTSDALSIY